MSEAAPATLDATLAELEAIRGRTRDQINGRARVFVPLCAVGGLIAWILARFGTDPPGFFEIFVFIGVGGGAGYFWASSKLSNAYRLLYKQRVLPLLAGQFGKLTYRQGVPDLDALRRHRLFEPFDGSFCEDEIVGDYRDLPLSIMELKLTHGSGDDERTIFDGLLTSVTLPRSLAGTTVVVPNRGLVGNLKDRLLGGAQPVVVEDPTFEKAFQVYATDQIAARALLTPAFMERFLAFSQSGRFGTPIALVEGPRLMLALSKGSAGNLFEPPSYSKPAAAREAIATLSSDIQHVLGIADAVIDLDYFARIHADDARARDNGATAVPPTP